MRGSAVSRTFPIARIFTRMNRTFMDPNEKYTRREQLRKRIVGKDRKLVENAGRRLVDGIRWKLANCLSTRITGPFNISVRYGERIERVRDEVQSAPSMPGFHMSEEIVLFEQFPCPLAWMFCNFCIF